MRKIIKHVLLAISVSLIAAACTDSKEYETSYCTLVDISGTYSGEKKSVVNIVKAGILPEMIPGDSLFFVKIDSNSYAEENLVTKLTLITGPLRLIVKNSLYQKHWTSLVRAGQSQILPILAAR